MNKLERQLTGLNAAALAMTSARSLEDTLQIITDQARDIIGAHQAVTSLVTDNDWAKQMRAVSLSDKYAEYQTYDARPDGSGIYAIVTEKNCSVRMTQQELEAHPRWRGFGKEAGRHPPMRGWLAAPILTRNGSRGHIQLSDRYEGDFTEEDEKILVQLAQLAAATIEIRTTHAELESRVLERTSELQRSNAELERFSYVVSHDLQEPLRKLVAFGSLLQKDLGNDLPELAKLDLRFITDAATRMQRLIRDLLAFSHSGRTALKHERVPLNECARRALEALEIRVQETGATVTCDELPEVQGDGTLLSQLYQNLIGNALKFLGDSRPIVRLTAETHDGRTVLGVSDNGIGIDPKNCEQIFVPFTRLHGRTQYEGTGIGLAICRQVVERHGGRIWVESIPGKGAHFKFTLNEQPDDPAPTSTGN